MTTKRVLAACFALFLLAAVSAACAGENTFMDPGWPYIELESGKILLMTTFTNYQPAIGVETSSLAPYVWMLSLMNESEDLSDEEAASLATAIVMRNFMGTEFPASETRMTYDDAGTQRFDLIYYVDMDLDRYAWELRCGNVLYHPGDVDDVEEMKPTPKPTATPIPGEKGEVTRLLERYRADELQGAGKSAEDLSAYEGKLVIAVFSYDGKLKEYSPETEGDFHGIPREKLADSLEYADRVIMVYRTSKQIGYYSTGGAALRAYTRVTSIVTETKRAYKNVLIATNDPPQTIRGRVGAGAAGEYEPEKALEYIRGKIEELEAANAPKQ